MNKAFAAVAFSRVGNAAPCIESRRTIMNAGP